MCSDVPDKLFEAGVKRVGGARATHRHSLIVEQVNKLDQLVDGRAKA